MIELKRNNLLEAIKYFEKAISLLHFQKTKGNNNHAFFLDPLAFVHYKNGELEKAREEYEKTISLTTGRLFYGNIYVKSSYMLGNIYIQQGNKSNAIEHYEKFLDLWKVAAPGIPEVDDARERLAGLRGEWENII